MCLDFHHYRRAVRPVSLFYPRLFRLCFVFLLVCEHSYTYTKNVKNTHTHQVSDFSFFLHIHVVYAYNETFFYSSGLYCKHSAVWWFANFYAPLIVCVALPSSPLLWLALHGQRPICSVTAVYKAVYSVHVSLALCDCTKPSLTHLTHATIKVHPFFS